VHFFRRRALPGAVAATAALAFAFAAPPARAEGDSLLLEIQTHFHATRKWFGMVSDLGLDRSVDGSLTPRFETLRSKFVLLHDAAGQTLSPRLPASASGAHVVSFDRVEGFTIRTEELGVLPVPAEVRGGLVVYRGAVAGGDLIYKLTPTHVDEYLYLRAPPAHLRREFEFDTGAAVWKLREAGTTIEALGKDGNARLRLSAPLARGADGTRRRGTAHVEGRRLILDVDLTGLRAPILVDPDWSTTGTMTVAHWGDTGWRRPDGRVMAVGGCALTACPTSFANSACGQVLASSDLWDPDSGTWTSAPAMLTARGAFAGIPLVSGDMLVAGGCTSTNCAQANSTGACIATSCTQVTALAERFSSASGEWIAAGALGTARSNPMGAGIAGGDAIVAGGCDVATCTTDTERWISATNSWTPRAPMTTARGNATATVLADGRVLLVGGCADPACATILDDATVYDPVADAWADAGVMASPRAGHTATLLDDGSVLVAGGCADGACATVLSAAEIWTTSGAGGAFSLAPSMAGTRHHHTATLLENGEVLAAGGANGSGATVPTSEVYLPVARQWIQTTAMLQSRAYHIGVGLSDGRVVVAGGCNPQTCIPFAEIFSPASLPPDGDAGILYDGGGTEEVDASDGAVLPAPPAASPHPPLYRDGVVACATDTTQGLRCPVAGWELQDGDFQPNMPSFTGGGEMVTDKTTGLVWQAYGDGKLYDQASAAAYCAGLAPNVPPAGAFRLPSVVELMTIVDYGRSGPATAPQFTGTQSTNYWTSTPTLGMQKLAWTVKFDAGEVIPLLVDTPLPVRCVNGTSSILGSGGVGLRKAGPLQVTGETVVDTTTRLEWQRSDDGTKRNWKDALSYCAQLSLAGKTGWHLANISELSGIVEFDQLNAGVVTDPAFQNTKADLYWSSTLNQGAPTLSWSVTFNLGVMDGVSVSGPGYARCVRHLDEPTTSVPASGGGGCGCTQAVGAGWRGEATAALACGLMVLGVHRRSRRRRHPGLRLPFFARATASRALNSSGKMFGSAASFRLPSATATPVKLGATLYRKVPRIKA
jgi:hypothetical protein